MSTNENSREVAQRLFAEELQNSTFQFKESDEEMAPNYLLLNSGAVANRVLIVGAITEKTNVGQEKENWRGRINDPTGNVFIYASHFQPETAAVLREIEPPEYLAIVGKPNTFENDDGEVMVNIRPESITVVDEETRDNWVLETAEDTLDRLADYEGSEFDVEDGNLSVPFHYGEEQQDELLNAVIEALEDFEE